MRAAELAQVPAGGAVAVDRQVFSQHIDKTLRNHPLVTIHSDEIIEIPESSPDSPVIIATGPLTSTKLSKSICELTGAANLSFYDAISPIILGSSIDPKLTYKKSRYDKGTDDYINIPLNIEQYKEFVADILSGEKFPIHKEVENETIGELRPFEGCMPIEDMAERGEDTMRFGPLKPVGLEHPETGKRPYAVIQLRQDNKEGTLWSMVGMQTRLKQPEQTRIFGKLPGLENAEYVRLGSVHRNSFINSPQCLDATLQFKSRPGLFIAGQISGVEGYIESTAGGLIAGINAERILTGKSLIEFPEETAMGSLTKYISDSERKNFQPMNISFGLIKSYSEMPRKIDGKRLSKKDRRELTSKKALDSLKKFIREELPSNKNEQAA